MKRVYNGVLKQFDVLVENKIGALANVCELLTENTINIMAISTSDLESGSGVLRVVTEDENITRDILDKSGLNFKMHDILNLRLIDRPGELAKITRIFSKSKIDIESVFILGKNDGHTEIALKVNNIEEAKDVLR